MAYNKAKEERKWRLWKEAKEKQLRSLGVGAEDIEKLRVHDWAVFNSDRRYYEKFVWLIFGCIVVSVCILILILSMWIKQRKYETGILLSIGITKGKIVFQYIVEVLLIAVCCFAPYLRSNLFFVC